MRGRSKAASFMTLLLFDFSFAIYVLIRIVALDNYNFFVGAGMFIIVITDLVIIAQTVLIIIARCTDPPDEEQSTAHKHKHRKPANESSPIAGTLTSIAPHNPPYNPVVMNQGNVSYAQFADWYAHLPTCGSFESDVQKVPTREALTLHLRMNGFEVCSVNEDKSVLFVNFYAKEMHSVIFLGNLELNASTFRLRATFKCSVPDAATQFVQQLNWHNVFFL